MPFEIYSAEFRRDLSFGNAEVNESYENASAIVVAAHNLEEALEIADRAWGPSVAMNGDFRGVFRDRLSPLKELLRRDFTDGARASYHRRIKVIIDRLALDAPSFEIASVAFRLISDDPNAYMGNDAHDWFVGEIQLDVSENGKRRIIYIHPELGVSFKTIRHFQMLQAIHAAF